MIPWAVPTSSRHALTFVLLTVLIDTIGFGIVLPVLPALIRDLRHAGLDAAPPPPPPPLRSAHGPDRHDRVRDRAAGSARADSRPATRRARRRRALGRL